MHQYLHPRLPLGSAADDFRYEETELNDTVAALPAVHSQFQTPLQHIQANSVLSEVVRRRRCVGSACAAVLVIRIWLLRTRWSSLVRRNQWRLWNHSNLSFDLCCCMFAALKRCVVSARVEAEILWEVPEASSVGVGIVARLFP